MLKLRKFTARQMEAAGYCGPRGGGISGTRYALEEEGKGLCSLDGGKSVFLLAGPSGKRAMEQFIADGGFLNQIAYRESI